MKKKSLTSDLPVSIILEDDNYDLDYQKELKCSEETINEDLKNQPTMFAWYAVLQEMAAAAVSEAKLDLEVTEATLDGYFRDESVKKKIKLLEKDIFSKIKLHDDYLKARVAVNTAIKNAGILRAIKDAFAHRKEMVLALASNMRIQSDPDIFIKKQEHRRKLAKK